MNIKIITSCKEEKEKGFRVIRLWEHEIKVMELNELKCLLKGVRK